MGQVLDDLIAIRACIDTPEKWTKHSLFRNKEGGHLLPTVNHLGDQTTPPKVASMCYNGAMITCGLHQKDHKGRAVVIDQVMVKANSQIVNRRNSGWIQPADVNWMLVRWNNHDDTKHSDMMAAFDNAISYAKQHNL